MRVALGLAAALVMAGCGQSEEQVRSELRHQLLTRCTADIAPTAEKAPGFDVRHFCGCLADAAMKDRSLVQVKELFNDREKMATMAREAGVSCRPEDAPARPDAGPAPPSAEEKADRDRAAREEREREERRREEREERLEKERAARRETERAAPKEDPAPPVVAPPRPAPTPVPRPSPRLPPPPPPEPQR